MTGAKRRQLAVLLLCAVAIPALWSYMDRRAGPNVMSKLTDFDGIYFGARCVMQGQDPYLPAVALRESTAEGGRLPLPREGLIAREVLIGVTLDVYLPTALFLAVPFALLPWVAAQTLWTVLTALLLALAAVLMADLCGEAPGALYLCLAGFALVNSEMLFLGGNPAGVAVSFCLIATWCFLRERWVWVGALLLAASLVVKPQDAGFVWLFFLLAGGVMRKRALQTLAVVGVLAVCAALWVAPASPHWVHELGRNVQVALSHGGLDYPGPSGMTARTPGQEMDLLSTFSYLWDDRRFYSLLAGLVGYGLIAVWAVAVLRKRPSVESSVLALAAVATLTFLPAYHRFYDSKLLLLTLPACALLWVEGGARRWVALALTAAGFVLTGDIPMVLLLRATRGLPSYPSTFAGKLVDVVCLEPAPLVLLALGVFYLWVFLRRDGRGLAAAGKNQLETEAVGRG